MAAVVERRGWAMPPLPMTLLPPLRPSVHVPATPTDRKRGRICSVFVVVVLVHFVVLVERSGDEDEPGRKDKNKCMVFKTASVSSIGFVF